MLQIRPDKTIVVPIINLILEIIEYNFYLKTSRLLLFLIAILSYVDS